MQGRKVGGAGGKQQVWLVEERPCLSCFDLTLESGSPLHKDFETRDRLRFELHKEAAVWLGPERDPPRLQSEATVIVQ